MLEPLYQEKEGLFHPSDLTRGGWSDEQQHGGPPSGLLAHVFEQVPTITPMQITRITFDLYRPIPIAPVSISYQVLREGKRIQLVEAILSVEGQDCMRATALKIRNAEELSLPELDSEPIPTIPEPTEMEPMGVSDHGWYLSDLSRFHIHAVEIRTWEKSFMNPGPGFSWFRLRGQVVSGQDPSPLVTLATLADMGNGNGTVLDPHRFLFVNPDINLHLYRIPELPWIGMFSVADISACGYGLADSLLFDRRGKVGRVTQSQLIDHQPFVPPPAS